MLRQKGFTLIELLIVIAIIAILAVVVTLTLNPAELLRRSRDSQRISDFATLNRAVSYYLATTASTTLSIGLLGPTDCTTESIKAGRGATDESLAGYKKALEGAIIGKPAAEIAAWTAKQVYIPLGFILDAAAQHHIDACPMEGFDHDKVSEIIGATKEGYAVNVLCPVGHRAADDNHAAEKKVRYPKERVIKVI